MKSPILISAAEAVKKIRKGQRIFVGGGAATPLLLTDALTKNADHFRDNELVHLLALGSVNFAESKYQGLLRDNSYFIGGNVRNQVQNGDADYTPIFLSEIPRLLRSPSYPVTAALIMVSPPDKYGMCSLGVSVDIVQAAIDAADIVIAQVNPQMPRTFGQSFVAYNKFDYVVESDHALPEMHPIEHDEITAAIGRNVAKLIGDGAVLQLGIGGIPDAVLNNLRETNDLGIHTETFSDGVIDLMQRGNITNTTKKILKGRTLTGLCLGTKKLFDYVHENPFVAFYPSDFVNDPFNIAQNDNMISINSALQIDLTGQVVADSIGNKFYSGIGGQVDFVRGAARSKGGKSIIALPATAKSGDISRITGQLTQGSGVVTSRGDVHYVVTEYGVAYLHGKSIRERAIELIHIAHPKFRADLMNFVKQNKYVYFDQKHYDQVNQYPAELEKKIKHKDQEFTLRPIKITDEKRLQDFFYLLGEESRYQRFFKVMDSLPHEMAQRFVDVDYKQNMALLVVQVGEFGESIVALGRYMGSQTDETTEMTFLVNDNFQGLGLGSLLCRELIDYAKAKGIKKMRAKSFVTNKAIRKVFDKQRDKFSTLSTYVDNEFIFFEFSFL